MRSRIDRAYISSHFTCTNAKIVPMGISDHSLISTTFHSKLSKQTSHRQGYTKMNTQILNHKPFVDDIESLITDLCEMDKMFLDERGEIDHLLTWDIWKCKILECANNHNNLFKKNNTEDIKKLQKQIQTLDFSDNYDPVLRQSLLNQLKEKLVISYENTFRTAKQEQIERDEKPTSYFYAIVASAKKQSTLDTLTYTESGRKVTTTDPDVILDQAQKFYQNLYDLEEINQNDQNWLFEHLSEDKCLSLDSKNKLDAEINEKEILTAIKGMQNNKTPGIDGIPKEFYEVFWDIIKGKFLLVVNKIREFKRLTITQQQAVLKLLYKKAERDNLANWRPISLLCTDYKIITKTLANRLQLVLHEIICEDQTCGIPTRSIFSNLRLYRNIIAHAQEKRLKAFLISLDQEKAFDRVNHEFLFRIMQKFNFGESFIDWIKTIYSYNESYILLNGRLSLPVIVKRGVRQGCPLSALLYLLTAEVLAEVIRKDNRIKGYPIPGKNKNVKIQQYADDTVLILIDMDSVVLAFKHIARFESGSGSKLNTSKCEGFALQGLEKHEAQNLKKTINIKWLYENQSIKLLGIKFFRNYIQTCRTNFQEQANKISDKIENLSKRSLSIRGRAIVANSLLTSKLWYIATILDIPSDILSKIESLVFKTHIWQDKTERIKRKSLYLPIWEGGIGLLNIQAQQDSLKLKNIIDIISPSSSSADKYFSLFWIRQKLATLFPKYFNLLVNNKTPTRSLLDKDIPLFFKNTLQALRENRELRTLFENANLAEGLNEKRKSINNKQIYKCILQQQYADYEHTSIRLYKDNYIRINIKWDKMWVFSFQGYCPNKMYETTWFLRHYALYTGDKIHKMYPRFPAPKCHSCNEAGTEDILHPFVTCSYAKPIWTFFANIFTSILEKEYPSWKLALGLYIGSHSISIERKKLALLLTTVINYYLWWQRNFNKYEKKSKIKHHSAISLIIQYIKLIINTHYKTLGGEMHQLKFAKRFCIGRALCSLSPEGGPIFTL